MDRYDAIVLGAGGVGSAALYHLARRGARVLGIDSTRPPHSLGSSHGHTRIIRQAYFEHPNYVPLLKESYHEWRALETRAGKQLFHQIGLVEVGPENGVVVPGVLRAAQEHQLAIESMSAAAIERRWPGLCVDNKMVGVYEPT
ncbi:MAG TPA: FAD-dependent oxidoreductase, partial [Lacipirellulaceae bacterium]|nr:FAD-dependent oxidoreductase [Lacipirellulaceae bacterium]